MLLVPDLGQTRKSLALVAARLRGGGYRVLAMDNTGQERNVTHGPRGRPTFKPLDTKILGKLRLDVQAAAEAVLAQAGASAHYGLVGYGIGANVAILFAGEAPEVGALVLVAPGHGCEEYPASDLIAIYGRRPLLLIESEKKVPTDFSTTIRLTIASRPDSLRERIVLPREPDSVREQVGLGIEELIDWVGTHLPVPNP